MTSIGTCSRVFTGALAFALALAAGCGGDDADDGASTDESGDDSGSSGPSSATMPSSMSATEPGDDDVADDDDDDGSSDSGGSSGAVDSSDGGSSSAGSSGDTGVTGCAALLDQATCMADMACMPITGSPLVVRGDVVCQGEREFIECQDSQACPEVITTACENKDTDPYVFGNACIPTGWSTCDAPGGGPFPPC
jgi:hypothetical protein